MIDNVLVPKHELLDPDGVEKVLKEYNATLEDLPKIKITDPAITELEPKAGDLIRITRNNPLVGESYYYRVVIP